jgi:hypothetical protein
VSNAVGVIEGIDVGKRIIVFVGTGVEMKVSVASGNCVTVDTTIESALGEHPINMMGKIVNINSLIFIFYPSFISTIITILSST